jgi:CBS domain-containing protein
MKVRSIMTGKAGVVTVDASDSVARAAELLVEHRIGALPVVDGQRAPVGLIAERDIAAAVHDHPADVTRVIVRRVMQRPPPTCQIDDEIRPMMARMTRQRLRHLLVLDGDHLAGIISVGDLLKHRLDELETEAGVLRDYVAGQRSRGG